MVQKKGGTEGYGAHQHSVPLRGRLVFSAHREFSQAIEEALASNASEIVLNLRDVEYIDSAALGMLLVARGKAKDAGKVISIEGTRGMVKQVLQIANFQNLFAIS
ncbi:STAS domain-containing protein [Niveibacterium sp. 24ML]|uniref:STAS domain-containing protein n=1 Tax=Niveibacterium sp. 24ML TaxID=2985512 RepID=UPI002270B541|nr:STAS domain-containing protein [Niveibacterium sp. 24ML]MCX9155484.1 STAS domain-containing protein [Niveibacterium sp. 24ML]